MTQHSENSSYREKLIEHIFIGEPLKLSWIKKDCSLEISKPEVDRAGYDVVAKANGVIRHIQFKASYIGSNTIGLKALSAKRPPFLKNHLELKQLPIHGLTEYS